MSIPTEAGEGGLYEACPSIYLKFNEPDVPPGASGAIRRSPSLCVALLRYKLRGPGAD